MRNSSRELASSIKDGQLYEDEDGRLIKVFTSEESICFFAEFIDSGEVFAFGFKDLDFPKNLKLSTQQTS
jgi:hypothetical protein